MSGSDSRKQHLRGLMMNTGGEAEPGTSLSEIDLHIETGLQHPQGINPVGDDIPPTHKQFKLFQALQDWRSRLLAFWLQKREEILYHSSRIGTAILLVVLLIGTLGGIGYFLYLLIARPTFQYKTIVTTMNLVLEPPQTGSMSSALAGLKCNSDHVPVMPRPVQSQLHQHVVGVLQTTQYMAFARLLDKMTESVIHQGITVFAPSDEALSDFQKNKKQSELRLEEVVRFHVITNVFPFSDLLRLEVGSRLTTDVSNVTILVTNATATACKVDDAVIVDPDLYVEPATIAIHGISAVFSTWMIDEEELRDKPVIAKSRVTPSRGLP